MPPKPLCVHEHDSVRLKAGARKHRPSAWSVQMWTWKLGRQVRNRRMKSALDSGIRGKARASRKGFQSELP